METLEVKGWWRDSSGVKTLRDTRKVKLRFEQKPYSKAGNAQTSRPFIQNQQTTNWSGEGGPWDTVSGVQLCNTRGKVKSHALGASILNCFHRYPDFRATQVLSSTGFGF